MSSALRISTIICCRSASVFSGIHAGIESDVAGSSRKGERRVNALNIQNGGTMNKLMSIVIARRKILQNPNLRRYIASVTGLAYGVHSGRLDSLT